MYNKQIKQAEDEISEHENEQRFCSLKNREETMKKNKLSLRQMWDIIKCTNKSILR